MTEVIESQAAKRQTALLRRFPIHGVPPFLPDFSPGRPGGPPSPDLPPDLDGETESFKHIHPPSKELESNAERIAEAEHAAALAAMAEAAEERLQASLLEAKLRFTDEIAVDLLRQLEQGLDRIEHHLSGALARLLEPLLAEGLRGMIVAEFAEALRRGLRGREPGVPIRITGPHNLISALAARLGTERERFELVAGDTLELACDLGETQLTSMLQPLRAAISDETAS